MKTFGPSGYFIKHIVSLDVITRIVHCIVSSIYYVLFVYVGVTVHFCGKFIPDYYWVWFSNHNRDTLKMRTFDYFARFKIFMSCFS